MKYNLKAKENKPIKFKRVLGANLTKKRKYVVFPDYKN